MNENGQVLPALDPLRAASKLMSMTPVHWQHRIKAGSTPLALVRWPGGAYVCVRVCECVYMCV